MATPDSDLKQWHGGMPKIAVKFTRIAAAALCSVQLNEVQVWCALCNTMCTVCNSVQQCAAQRSASMMCSSADCLWVEARSRHWISPAGKQEYTAEGFVNTKSTRATVQTEGRAGKKNTGLFGNFPSIRPNPVPLWYRFERSYHSMVIWNRPRQVNGNGWKWLNVDERGCKWIKMNENICGAKWYTSLIRLGHASDFSMRIWWEPPPYCNKITKMGWWEMFMVKFVSPGSIAESCGPFTSK